MANEMIWYDGCCKVLVEACVKSRTVSEAINFRDSAIGMEAYARAAKNLQMLADAWEIKVNATRRLGEMMENGKADRAPVGKPPNGVSETPLPTLKQAGIDKNLAKRARKLYGFTKKRFALFVMDGRKAISDGVDRALRTIDIIEERSVRYRTKHKTEMVKELAAISGPFDTIYADPPWTFEVYSGKGKQRSAERYYDTMKLEEIKNLPVAKIAAKDCALFLWTVWPELPGALEVIEAWGFEYKTAAFVWVKQVSEQNEKLFTGMGYWTRANSEPCLLAIKGKPLRLNLDVHQIITAPVGKHSEKPEIARERIECLVGGPYLELFGRKKVEGWTVWGDEV
jgi:N6-adenosine-specific RNA methylase IME4